MKICTVPFHKGLTSKTKKAYSKKQLDLNSSRLRLPLECEVPTTHETSSNNTTEASILSIFLFEKKHHNTKSAEVT